MAAIDRATTSHRETVNLVHNYFNYIPKGASYYLTTFDTIAVGSPPETMKHSLDALCRELRAAARDPKVGHVTVLILYDGPEDGESRTPPVTLEQLKGGW